MLLFDFPHYRVSKRHGSTFVSPQVLKENILVLCIILPGNLILLMTSLFYWRMLLEYIYIYIYTFSATLTFGFFNFKLLS
jgi:hypothetical protein